MCTDQASRRVHLVVNIVTIVTTYMLPGLSPAMLFSYAFNSVLVCRFILNIRTSYTRNDSRRSAFASSIRFATTGGNISPPPVYQTSKPDEGIYDQAFAETQIGDSRDPFQTIEECQDHEESFWETFEE
ncbi:hypothetical protein NLI96_g11178 [Meripilus lineatus]|uniref:Uncharacterized protein n=1 Tax=Meripilus lineatus TaxID=2056292 RepID=A0AAD5US82_9APHY|nr:hypothetical protein NLI96_g11178 [Physisporinus lineatus]